MPVLLPLLAAAALLALERVAPRAQFAVALVATLAGLAVALGLFTQAATGAVGVYLLGNWPAPYGITLVLDRLSALMVRAHRRAGAAGIALRRGAVRRNVRRTSARSSSSSSPA